jgi:peptide/nickel transport system permease protein
LLLIAAIEAQSTAMISYVVRRILATIPVMAVVALFVFGLLHLSPGDPAAIIAGDNANGDEIARIHAALGLDRPLYVQFGAWVWQLLHGDFGISIFTQLPVIELIGQRIEPTIALTVGTLIVSVAVALPLGIVAAWKAGRLIDRLVMTFAVLGFSVPVFVLAYLLIYVFAVATNLLPVQGYVSPGQGIGPFLSHLVMPATALGMVYAALIARITRASMLEVLSQDYIRTAQAKGLSNKQVLLGHALKNAAVPIVTIIGIGVALLISGVVVTETVFAIPGLGRLTVDAILRRDYPIIQGVILIFSAAYVLINLIVDLSYAMLDPRIRY